MEPQIMHYKDFLSKEDTSIYFASLMGIPWKKVPWKSGGYLPRKVYSYMPKSSPRINVLETLSSHVELLFNTKVLSIWCNLYEDGKDWAPFHQDSYGSDVYTISFGSTRRCIFESIETGEKTEYLLEDGDVLFFTPAYDEKHKHSIPKTTKVVGPRISVVLFVDSKGESQLDKLFMYKEDVDEQIAIYRALTEI